MARLIYGVSATFMDVADFGIDYPDEWRKIEDRWTIPHSGRTTFDFIMGIPCYEAYGNDFNEIGSLDEPSKEILDELQKVLKKLGIRKKPKWILTC